MLTDFGLSFMSVDSRPLTLPAGSSLESARVFKQLEPRAYEGVGRVLVWYVCGRGGDGEYPWGNCPDPAVVFQMKRGLVFPRPKAFVDNEQWQFVQALCAPDPSKRLKMPDAIHLLKKFADQEQMQEWSSKAEDHEFD
ncbi:hypothetical protein AM588_10010119 [Phytophthora nicotianae]|uniref:Protein kinase domain-containing protein n=1 Tax=Phytophthora nicotianae TaxID=4792 RepID=A0A0W8DK00_PHYNI|nr:hypothetical protein AM588_10010119 [Phytophthora nicotianae]